MLRIGDIAPDFELRLHNGHRFRLSDQRGERNVVLYFYPKDFTLGVTKASELFSSHIEEIGRLNATVIGISGDTLENHRRFAKTYELAFPLASDPKLIVCRNYRAVWLLGMAMKKITYVIDLKGRIRAIAHHELLVKRHWDHVLRVLRQIQEESTYSDKSWKH
ncbi:MAG: peroxiredoxin [Ignavibacteriales bacterium]|nr:peroxiredoxin [Ignavibacteriales bacterium]